MIKMISILVFLLMSSCSNEYYVNAYKTEHEINSLNDELLQSRFTTEEFKDFNLHLEWNTYDNQIINKAPYKLYLVLEPKSNYIKKIEINSVNLLSSKNTSYIVGSRKWPVMLANINNKRDSVIFNPPFNFDFNNNEQIESIIEIKVIYKDKAVLKKLRHKWIPIKVKKYAPFV